MITEARARAMSNRELAHARLDLVEVIAIQERSERDAPGSCPKLGEYWDDLYEVILETRRRARPEQTQAGYLKGRDL